MKAPFIVHLCVNKCESDLGLLSCAGPIPLGIHFWCENGLPSIHEWMGKRNEPSETEQGLRFCMGLHTKKYIQDT